MILEKEKYHKVIKLINSSNDLYPLMISTINKDIDGTIYTDNSLNWALIINRLNWIYLIGSVKNIEDIINIFSIVLENHKSKEYLWWGLDEKTESIINKNYSVNIKNFPRYKWQFDKNVFLQIPETGNSFKIKRINENNINKIFVNEYNPIKNFWDNTEIFLQKGFGFFIEEDNQQPRPKGTGYVASPVEMHSGFNTLFERPKGRGIKPLSTNKVISVIYSAGVYNNEVEIDILTDKNYRNKGLGKILIQRFIKECILRKITPKWDCSITNESSIFLAKKYGFKIDKEYTVKQIILGN